VINTAIKHFSSPLQLQNKKCINFSSIPSLDLLYENKDKLSRTIKKLSKKQKDSYRHFHFIFDM
jgi:hypothetical protein